MIVKIYLGLSLVVLWAVWGQFIFRQFLGPAYISQDLQAPSYVVGTNDRVLIYFTCHFQGGSLCFSFFCLLVSSVSNFCPDTRGLWWTPFRLTCSVVLWGGRKQRPPGGEKGESKRGESSQASNLARKKKWILKIGFLKIQN